MSYKDKYATLVTKLYEATGDGLLKWSFDPEQGGLLYTPFGDHRLYIGEGENSKSDPIVWISIYDKSMNVIDNFNDDLLRGRKPSGYDDYWTYMSELYQMAKRSATGADVVIEDILKKLDFPF
jgi:hypothetical protein